MNCKLELAVGPEELETTGDELVVELLKELLADEESVPEVDVDPDEVLPEEAVEPEDALADTTTGTNS